METIGRGYEVELTFKLSIEKMFHPRFHANGNEIIFENGHKMIPLIGQYHLGLGML